MTQILAERPGAWEGLIVSEHSALEIINMLDDSGDFPIWSVGYGYDSVAEWREHFIEYLHALLLGVEFLYSIKEHGIKVPGLIGVHHHWQRGRYLKYKNGHHRLAAALRMGISMPVLWEDDEHPTAGCLSTSVDYPNSWE